MVGKSATDQAPRNVDWVSSLSFEERSLILEDVSHIIRSVSISRGAVISSTPEQIVWMTQKAIEENLIAYANREPSNHRWLPQVYGVVADIKRAVLSSKMTEKAKAQAIRAIERGAEGWPS